ncbi:MAG: hypothetical protein Q4G43_04655 [Mobilicoccus sp.]|nr:hypothetical protein [Mobilicoccus sp.]
MSTIAITDILSHRHESLPLGRLAVFALALIAVAALVALNLLWLVLPLVVGALGYLGASIAEARFSGPASAREYHASAEIL